MTEKSKAYKGTDSKNKILKDDPKKSIQKTELPSIEEQLEHTPNALEAFHKLQKWTLTPEVLQAQADEVEEAMFNGGMELLRLLLKEHIEARGTGDVGKSIECATADGKSIQHNHHLNHDRKYESIFGEITIDRLGYICPGEKTIHPLDEMLNLPRRKYSYVLQKRGVKLSSRGPYDEAVEMVDETTSAHIPKRQLIEIVQEAAVDFEDFYEEQCHHLPPPEETGSILVSGIDCKGIPKRKTEEEKAEKQPVKLGPGEKRTKKKMSTVASVHTTEPYVRTAEEIACHLIDGEKEGSENSRPRPEDRRLWASVLKDKDAVIIEVAQEMKRRDPLEEKIAVCVMDGEEALKTRAIKHLKKQFPQLIMVLDIIHVLGYLWDAAHVFNPVGSEEALEWVRERLLLILQGEVSLVASGIRQSATKRGIKGKKRETIDKSCNYFLKNKDRMRYDEYLSAGLPIASGAVEGACGHLVKDRMERTGALWDVREAGAEAVLKIRALDKSGDFNEYWKYHVQKEEERLYGKQEWKVAA